MRMAAGTWRKILLEALKVAGTAFLLWFAFRKVPAGTFARAAQGENWSLALASLGVYGLGMSLVEASRYLILARALRSAEDDLPLREWVALYLESRPWVYLLPASAGAEAVLWRGLRGHRWTHRQCGALVLGTRVIGLGIWVLLLGVALGLAPSVPGLILELPRALKGGWAWGALGAAIVAVSILAIPLFAGEKGRRFPAGPMLLAVAAGVVSAAVVCAALLLGAASAGLHLTFLEAAGFTAVLNIGMVLPISLAGLGLQEALLLRLGAGLATFAPAPLMALSAILHLQRLGLALLGGGVILGRRHLPGAVAAQGQQEPARCPEGD